MATIHWELPCRGLCTDGCHFRYADSAGMPRRHKMKKFLDKIQFAAYNISIHSKENRYSIEALGQNRPQDNLDSVGSTPALATTTPISWRGWLAYMTSCFLEGLEKCVFRSLLKQCGLKLVNAGRNTVILPLRPDICKCRFRIPEPG